RFQKKCASNMGIRKSPRKIGATSSARIWRVCWESMSAKGVSPCRVMPLRAHKRHIKGRRLGAGGGARNFFARVRRKPLKRLDCDEEHQGNPRSFSWDWLGLAWTAKEIQIARSGAGLHLTGRDNRQRSRSCRDAAVP